MLTLNTMLSRVFSLEIMDIRTAGNQTYPRHDLWQPPNLRQVLGSCLSFGCHTAPVPESLPPHGRRPLLLLPSPARSGFLLPCSGINASSFLCQIFSPCYKRWACGLWLCKKLRTLYVFYCHWWIVACDLSSVYVNCDCSCHWLPC